MQIASATGKDCVNGTHRGVPFKCGTRVGIGAERQRRYTDSQLGWEERIKALDYCIAEGRVDFRGVRTTRYGGRKITAKC